MIRECIVVRANPSRRVDRRSELTHDPLIRGRLIIGLRQIFIWRRSFALRSFYGFLKLLDERLAEKWRSTLAVDWLVSPQFTVTRFLKH